jgi:phosphate transport system substrate-binding protein
MRTSRRAAAIAVAAALVLTACGGGTQDAATPAAPTPGSAPEAPAEPELAGSVRIDGSSTVAPFAEVAAELFMMENRGVQVTVGTSGTGGGFEKFCNAETDISDASRSIKSSEAELCTANGVAYEEVLVALDGLAVVVSNDNDFVSCLTVEELATIWGPDAEGKVTSWKQVRPDFPDLRIDLYGPGTDSGTFDFFTEAINGEAGASRADFNASEDDNVIVQGVAGSKGGIGYFGLSYLIENAGNLKGVEVDGGSGCVAPSSDTVLDGTYTPLARPLFMYPSDKALARPEVVAFLDFVIANQREIAAAALFVPLSDALLAEAQAKVDSLK